MMSKRLLPFFLTLGAVTFLLAPPAGAYKSAFCTPLNTTTGGPSAVSGSPFSVANNCARTDSNRAVTIAVAAGKTSIAPGSSRAISWALPEGVKATGLSLQSRTTNLSGDWRLKISGLTGG